MSEEKEAMTPSPTPPVESVKSASSAREESRRQRASIAAGADGRVSRWLWVVLVVSLSLNMLILGAIGAMMWMHHRAGMPLLAGMGRDAGAGGPQAGGGRRGQMAPLRLARPGLIMISLRQLLHRLPRERRRALRRHLRAHRQQIVRAFRQVARARAAFLRLLREGNPAPARLDAALNTLLQAEEQARRALLELVRAMVSALTPRERRMFARIMQQGTQRHHFFRP